MKNIVYRKSIVFPVSTIYIPLTNDPWLSQSKELEYIKPGLTWQRTHELIDGLKGYITPYYSFNSPRDPSFVIRSFNEEISLGKKRRNSKTPLSFDIPYNDNDAHNLERKRQFVKKHFLN